MPKSNLLREFTNLPNLVTMARVVLIPFVLLFIDNFNPLRSFIASLLYLIAAAVYLVITMTSQLSFRGLEHIYRLRRS